MKTSIWIKIWLRLRLLLIFGLVVFLYSFSSSRNSKRKIDTIKVVFENNEHQFIDKQEVEKKLKFNTNSISEIKKLDLNLHLAESTLQNLKSVEEANVFVAVNGNLTINIKQRTPIARVFDENKNFYIDYLGTEMPTSSKYSARVLSVYGNIENENKENLNSLFKYIYDDDFLKKNIIAVNILPNNELEMLNRNNDFKIDFGKCINWEQKFNNYKAFYQKKIEDNTNNYRKISLRYTKQVVCTK